MKRVRSVNILMADATQSMVRTVILLNLNMPEIDRNEALKLFTSDLELLIEITHGTGNLLVWHGNIAVAVGPFFI